MPQQEKEQVKDGAGTIPSPARFTAEETSEIDNVLSDWTQIKLATAAGQSPTLDELSPVSNSHADMANMLMDRGYPAFQRSPENDAVIAATAGKLTVEKLLAYSDHIMGLLDKTRAEFGDPSIPLYDVCPDCGGRHPNDEQAAVLEAALLAKLDPTLN